jgi:hypothetical protein
MYESQVWPLLARTVFSSLTKSEDGDFICRVSVEEYLTVKSPELYVYLLNS